MKKYSLLFFQQTDDKFSKWIFPLHQGENIIGSDKEVDIFLYLDSKTNIIDSIHCKIIVNELKNEVKIINLSTKGYVKREYNDEKILLSPGKEYELNHKNIFYISDTIKFTLIKGTIQEIKDFFYRENLENEFHKWNDYIINKENNIKCDLNLSLNKSFISNNNDNNLNNVNNSNHLNNSAYKNNGNNNHNLFGSNSKEFNRVGFNNFDEVPENLIMNDYKISKSSQMTNLLNKKINMSPMKSRGAGEKKNFDDNKINNNYDMINSTFINNEKDTELNSNKSETKEELKLFNGKSNLLKDYLLNSFERSSQEIKKNNKYNEKVIIKDARTLKLIKKLFGENNLEVIIKGTNLKEIKKYDILFKNMKKKPEYKKKKKIQ